MEIEPTSFFRELTTFAKDLKKGPSESLRLLETLNRNLIEEQLNTSFIDLFLIHIFEKSNGLLHFLDATVKIKEFKNAVIKAEEILYTLVNNFPSKLAENNVLDIYHFCNNIIKLNVISDVKVKALELLLLSLEKLNIYFEDNDMTSTYKEILNSLQIALKQKHCDTVKHKELMALGYFAKQYQYLISDHKHLQLLFVRNLEPELIKPKKSQHLICGFFTGFSYFCESFPLDVTKNEDKKLIERFYKLIYNLVVPMDKVKIGNRAALSYLAHYISLFREFLLKHYKFWHTNLLKWLGMGADEKKVGALVLRALFQDISTLICEKTEGDFTSVVQYFNQWSLDVLKKNNVSNYEKHLSIHCLKFFCRASYKFLPNNDVTNLFLMIMETFENNYILNYDPRSEEWEYLPDYVQVVANFMPFKIFTASEFYCLQRAVVNMIKSFHHLPYLHYQLVIDGIIITCFYLKKTQYFDPFLENMIYQGIVWSCSHKHISNAEFLEEHHENIVTVRNFFPLWIGILKLPSNRAYDKYGIFLEDRKYIFEMIVNQLVRSLMILINKLNVSIELKDEDIAATEMETAYQVVQTNDHAIFLNVVDFYQEIFENIEPRIFKKCICKMMKHILNKCITYPLISGFYKLLSFSLKIANKLNLFKEFNDGNQDIENMKETLKQFIKLILDRMSQYKDELLIACLKVLLDCPVVLIKDMLPICVTPFITVFTVGRSYFELAEMGLNTLHQWQNNLSTEEYDAFVSKIIPSLDSYLRSKSLLGETQSNVAEKRRKTAQVLKKRRVVIEMEPELIKLQKKILSFIGKQSSRVCHAFIYSGESNEVVPASVYGGKLHLKVILPYEDVRVDVYLDAFVPHVINLALYSSNRKTKITACELLQATVMVFLGRAKSITNQRGLSELDDLLKAMAMPLLQLGCDIDHLAQQIFSPLVFQLIHWYASPSQLRGGHTAIIIDALMEGITHPTNSCLRDFSGKCIQEFVKWTIKQMSEQLLSVDPINIKILIKKMRFFSAHTDPIKKLGAALIFNNTYREIREEESLTNIFWFEILHIFVNSLSLMENNSLEDGTTIIQINNALRHVERVLVEKAKVFQVSDNTRRIPSDIEGSTLKDVAVWLLKQTGNNNKHCREASMKLFIAVAPLISNKKVNLKAFINEVFETDFVSVVYENSLKTNPVLQGISHSEDCSVLLKWMQNFCCALDGYNFVIKNNLHDINFESNITFDVINYFLIHLQEADMAEALNLIEQKTWIFTTFDIEQFKKQKRVCVLSILKLYNAIIMDEILLKKSAPIWNVEFWKLILNVIFQPQLINLEDKISQVNHLEMVKMLLNRLPRKIPENNISVLVETLRSFLEKNFTTCIDLKRNVTLLQRNIIKGIFLLNSTNIHKLLNTEKYVTGLINKLMQNFYDTLKDNVLYISDFQETTFEYCSSIFELALTNMNELKDLINYLHQPYVVQSMEFSKEVKFGIFILNMFGETIIPVVLRSFDIFLNYSIEAKNLVLTTETIMFILNFIAKTRGEQLHQNIFKVLLNKWGIFENLFMSNVENGNLGIEYVKILIPFIKSQDVEQLHSWLINRLLQEKDLNNKLEIFYLLINIVEDINLNSRADLENALTELFNNITSIETTNTNFIFDKILHTMPNLKSTIILKFIIQLYKKLSTSVDVQPLLKQFVHNIDVTTQGTTLEVLYEIAKDKQTVFQDRYKVIKNIIPPLFQSCHISSFEKFYIDFINEIITVLQSAEDCESHILNFVLIEILFLRIPIGKAEQSDLILSAANNPKLLGVFLKFTLDAFKKHDVASKETLRLYKCHAYNALASIICNSVKSINFYEKLFIRYENDKEILWNSIIDTSINLEFPIVFDSIPTRRKLVTNIRDELRTTRIQSGQKSRSFKYIESQKLFNSSLSEDITNFDFTNTSLRSEKATEDESDNELSNYQSEIQLDAEDINNHECMATICGLIQHIFDTGVSELPEADEEQPILPNWMNDITPWLHLKKQYECESCGRDYGYGDESPRWIEYQRLQCPEHLDPSPTGDRIPNSPHGSEAISIASSGSIDRASMDVQHDTTINPHSNNAHDTADTVDAINAHSSHRFSWWPGHHHERCRHHCGRRRKT